MSNQVTLFHGGAYEITKASEPQAGIVVEVFDMEEDASSVAPMTPAECDALIAAIHRALGRPAPASTPPAHAALDGTSPRKPPPRAPVKAEPAQSEGATLPTVSADGPLIKVVEGLRGVVTRWERSGLGSLTLVAFQRLDGTPARAHPVTVERHRGCAVEWVRGRARS